MKKSIETIKCLQLSIQDLSWHVLITQKQLDDLQMQIQTLTWKIEETSYSFHWMVELEVIKTKNTFMKVELLIYQQKVRKNWTKQWELYKAQITKILNNTFTNYRKDEKLL